MSIRFNVDTPILDPERTSAFEWERLGLAYPLKDVEPPTAVAAE